MRVALTALIVCLGAHGDPAGPAAAKRDDTARRGCSDQAEYRRMNFWLGTWNVYAGGALDGKNRIVSILNGCAIEENWSDASGYEGKSWFYLDTRTHRFKQLWLTDHANELGGTKEKSELPQQGSALRFQGELEDDKGKRIFDRTTLTPLPDGTVHQLIETSRDGARWSIAYDAIYRRES